MFSDKPCQLFLGIFILLDSIKMVVVVLFFEKDFGLIGLVDTLATALFPFPLEMMEILK